MGEYMGRTHVCYQELAIGKITAQVEQVIEGQATLFEKIDNMTKALNDTNTRITDTNSRITETNNKLERVLIEIQHSITDQNRRMDDRDKLLADQHEDQKHLDLERTATLSKITEVIRQHEESITAHNTKISTLERTSACHKKLVTRFYTIIGFLTFLGGLWVIFEAVKHYIAR